MKRILAFILAVAAVIADRAEVKEASVAVINSVKFQHVTGFGGFSPSPTWQYWLNNTDMDKLFGKGEDQLGLNILRLYMANSRGAWSAGVANAKRARQHGAFIFASPWSPPGSWKSNGSDSNGGRLLESHYADWANFLNDYYKYMKGQGVEIDAVSVQNEPDWNASYQSCIWTGEEMAAFLRDYGHLIECQVIAPEAIHFTRSMHEPILNDDGACERLDILGGHFYGWDGSSYPLAAQKGKEVWMTEFLINERQQNEGKDINWVDDGFLFAKSVNDAMLANMSAWVHYSLKRYYGCIGDGSYGTVNGQITKRGYILSHYAKYVSGTTRVRHTVNDPSGRLSASAYETDEGNIVMMVLNPSADTYDLDFVLPFNTMGCRTIVTTEAANMAKAEIAFDEETSTPEISIEPYSVCTLIFDKSSDKSGGSSAVEGTEVFADNFDLYGASCVPDGWLVYTDEGTIRYAGDYSLGPRIMAFSPEGAMRYGFYFRSGASTTGYISYGDDSNLRLHLTPATYTLKYSAVGWKSLPDITCSVRKATGRGTITSFKAAPDYQVEASGASQRIVATSDYEVTFDISAEDNYLLRWTLDRSGGGYREALVGNISLLRHETEGISDVTIDASAPSPIYDIYGRPVAHPTAPGIYIQSGRKVIVR